jgi:hypothetical protein
VTAFPTATFAYPTAVNGRKFTLAANDAQVPGHPEATEFTYSYNCGFGWMEFIPSSTMACEVYFTGTHDVGVRVRDIDGDVTTYVGKVTTSFTYTSAGFKTPVNAEPVVNVAKAGQTIALRISLADADGTPVVGLPGWVKPTVTEVACASGSVTGAVEGTTFSGISWLFPTGDGNYQYNWGVPTSFAGSCRRISLELGDGTARTALFKFSK